MEINLAVVFAFLVVSGLALFVFLLVGRLIRPQKFDPVKASTYECGERPFGQAWFSFNNRFYVIALVFIVFDVEVVLTVPAVVVFRRLLEQGLGWLAFLEIVVFLGILLVALIYAWSRGDLSWVKALQAPTCAPVEVGDKERQS